MRKERPVLDFDGFRDAKWLDNAYIVSFPLFSSHHSNFQSVGFIMASAATGHANLDEPQVDDSPGKPSTSNEEADAVKSQGTIAAPADADPKVDVAAGDKPLATDISQGSDEGELVENPKNIDRDNGANSNSHSEESASDTPPLPEEEVPPLPEEPVPEQDDGWAPIWDQNAQAFYFYNRFTGATQWTNPRVPDPAVQPGPPGVMPVAPPAEEAPAPRPAGGYDPAIHGDYDPNAWYAQPAEPDPIESTPGVAADQAAAYTATGQFNRFTGRWQAADLAPENFNDENKSKRQMNAFFDVDAAANSHDGKSLKAERAGKRLTKSELKQFKEKRKAKKEEKRRAWLRD